MTVESKRSQWTKQDPNSFGAWFAEKCDHGTTIHQLEAEYPTVADQIGLCWRMHRTGFDPYDTHHASLSDELMWHDLHVMERQREEARAWEDHDFPITIHEFDCAEQAEIDFSLFGQRVRTGYRPVPESLLERIFEAFPDFTSRTSTKKRRALDRTARNERRDGSPRSKVWRGVNKRFNDYLRNKERQQVKLTLHTNDPTDEYTEDASALLAYRRRAIPSWSTGGEPRAKQE